MDTCCRGGGGGIYKKRLQLVQFSLYLDKSVYAQFASIFQ